MTTRANTLPRAVLDANILLQAALRDTLLRAAEAVLYVPFWGPTILAEVEHELPRLIARYPDAAQRASRLTRQLQLAFPRALVRDDPNCLPLQIVGATHGQVDPGDAHVIAAALAAQATSIVTDNVRHFPALAIESMGVVALTGDQFLLQLWHRFPAEIAGILQEQGAALRPPRTRAAILLALSHAAPQFVAAVSLELAEHEITSE